MHTNRFLEDWRPSCQLWGALRLLIHVEKIDRHGCSKRREVGTGEGGERRESVRESKSGSRARGLAPPYMSIHAGSKELLGP